MNFYITFNYTFTCIFLLIEFTSIFLLSQIPLIDMNVTIVVYQQKLDKSFMLPSSK